MKIKPIKTTIEHEEAVKFIDELMAKDPNPDSPDGEKLDLLVTLVQDYESKAFPETLPDPIDAILFRMEQGNLKPADLIPYLGSRSRVSEILSRKRPLTLSMIRSLEAGLGIPAKVLLKEPDQFRDSEDVTWSRFPIKEMQKRGYLGNIDNIKNAMENFFMPVGAPEQFFGMLRKSNYRSLRPMDKNALVTWSAIVVKKAKEEGFSRNFVEGSVNLSLMQKVVQFSVQKNGPIVARDFLKSIGISLIIEPHFIQTYLDGASILIDKKHPIIGLTLRHDRLDNFWFNLMHELAHISLHFNQNTNFFYDDLDSIDSSNDLEKEADNLAREALVPVDKWESSPARLIPSPVAAESLAKELGVHIAIVAGKMRFEGNNYAYLNNIINQAKVRENFPEKRWS